MCIKPKKSSLRIGSCAKLTPRFCGPFKIIERIGLVAYRLALPSTVRSRWRILAGTSMYIVEKDAHAPERAIE